MLKYGIDTISAWRHWGCVTPRILQKWQTVFNETSDIDGYDELTEADKRKVDKAVEEGKVDDADIPDSARKPEGDGEGEEEDEKKKAPAKKVH